MFIANSVVENGTLLVFGLSGENLRRLRQGQPIRMSRQSHGMAIPADLQIVIFAGETEATMEADLRKAGLIWPSTVMNQRKPT